MGLDRFGVATTTEPESVEVRRTLAGPDCVFDWCVISHGSGTTRKKVAASRVLPPTRQTGGPSGTVESEESLR
jgi:hypothetical protein